MDINLSHADLSIYTTLCHLRNKFWGPDILSAFYISDRALAYKTRTSTRTVYLTKHKLRKLKLISFHVGPDHKTFYNSHGL